MYISVVTDMKSARWYQYNRANIYLVHFTLHIWLLCKESIQRQRKKHLLVLYPFSCKTSATVVSLLGKPALHARLVMTRSSPGPEAKPERIA